MIKDSYTQLSEPDYSMGAREEGAATCVTWSSVPVVVPVLIHLSAAIETAKGSPATGDELLHSLKELRKIRRDISPTPEEYKAVSARYSDGTSGTREPALPRDIIVRILESLLSKQEPIAMLSGHKGGVPLRAWLPTDLVARVHAFCKRRCSKSSFFITAATGYFADLGVNITTIQSAKWGTSHHKGSP